MQFSFWNVILNLISIKIWNSSLKYSEKLLIIEFRKWINWIY